MRPYSIPLDLSQQKALPLLSSLPANLASEQGRGAHPSLRSHRKTQQMTLQRSPINSPLSSGQENGSWNVTWTLTDCLEDILGDNESRDVIRDEDRVPKPTLVAAIDVEGDETVTKVCLAGDARGTTGARGVGRCWRLNKERYM